MKKRSIFLDNFKGILICLVVFGHFIYPYGANGCSNFVRSIFTLIYLFHMPAFVFCSGYLSKSEKSRGKTSIVRLLLYYLVFNTLMMLFCYLEYGQAPALLTPYNSYWYILSLIFWRLGVKHLDGVKGIVPFSIAAALLVGFWGEFSNTLSLARTVAFFVFFLLGYRLDEQTLQRLLQGRTRLRYILSLALTAAVGLGLFLFVRNSGITEAMLTMQPYSAGKEMIWRAFIMAAAAVAIFLMLLTVPNTRIPLLTRLGRNSLLIYLAHRFVTLVFQKIFPYTSYSRMYLLYALIASVITLVVLGSDRLNGWVSAKFSQMADAITDKSSSLGRRLISLMLVLALLIGAVPAAQRVAGKLRSQSGGNVPAATGDAIVISYVGDLILQKTQVEAAYDENTDTYDFSAIFEYAEPYLSQADLAIGVLEGPLAGAQVGYSTADYGDGYKYYLNFPDSFAQAIKDAGIDLVTTANNHLLDMGTEGALRTLDVLDDVGLMHTGSYRNEEEKNTLQIIEVEGIRIAVLSYTEFINYHSTQDIVTQTPHLTSVLPDSTDDAYTLLRQQIEADFARANQSEADLILVLPHMGTQFSQETDAFQDEWNQIFAELGADIILGDHVHTVQPIEYIGDTLVVNCPGNFANAYIGNDADAKAIVEIYIDRNTKEVTGAGVIPMYTQEMEPGYFRALPIYDVLSSNELYEQMPARDLERIKEVHRIVTGVMLGQELTVDNIQPRYYFINGQYCEYELPLVEDYESYRDTALYQALDEASRVVFIGDGITRGANNGGHPWYEPLMEHFSGKEIVNISKTSCTTQQMVSDYADEIQSSQGDLYIVAIGTNDVRYRNSEACAMTPEAYVQEMDALVSLIRQSNPGARIILISPWMTLDNDGIAVPSHAEKRQLIHTYGDALKRYAEENGCDFIDPNDYLTEFFQVHQRSLYTSDGIHPNAAKGIELYTKAILESSD